MITVTVDGYGRFQINGDKVSELLAWLSRNEGVAIRENNAIKEVKDNNFTGRELLHG